MSSSEGSCFGYRIRPAADGWAWMTFDLQGCVQEEGWAPEKAIAAALIVRALARGAAHREAA